MRASGIKGRIKSHWLLLLAPLIFTSCSPESNTILINNTAQPLVIEAVQNYGASYSELNIPNADGSRNSAYASWTAKRATHQKYCLAPEQTCYLGNAVTFFSSVPLNGDTIIVRTADGWVRRLTASSVSQFVTDTTRGSIGVEGPRYVTYTIRIKD